MTTRLAATAAAALALIAAPPAARADEGGVSFWVPGQYGSFAAIAPQPGFALPMVGYFYSGSAGASEAIPVGGRLELGLDGRYLGEFFVPSYAPDTTFLGARPNFSAMFITAYSEASAVGQLGPLATAISDTQVGVGDIIPTAQLFWNSGVHNWMAYATGDIPVGSYDPDRLANIGLGHAAIDLGGAYTYLDRQKGIEFSAAAGLTYNFENPDTDYTSGIDAHLDWAVARLVNEKFFFGAVGYVYQQLTPDKGQPAILGEFKSRTIGIGPQIGYTFDAGGVPIFTNLRGYLEIDVKNRTKGGGMFFTLNIPLNAPKAAAK